VDQVRPCNHHRRIRPRQGANAEPNKKKRGSSDLSSRSCDDLAWESRSCAASSVTT
jgi:hypothetical protein